ncbi:MAG TPA: hypothetical protein VFC78_15350 [Tepidisphaeraceae bacterium]|nr:hypothetical protein [Tepidisphaeraceae bacterium]
MHVLAYGQWRIGWVDAKLYQVAVLPSRRHRVADDAQAEEGRRMAFGTVVGNGGNGPVEQVWIGGNLSCQSVRAPLLAGGFLSE